MEAGKAAGGELNHHSIDHAPSMWPAAAVGSHQHGFKRSRRPPPPPKTATASTPSASTGSYRETQREHPGIYPEMPRLPDNDPVPHCPLAKGSWCGAYWTQQPVPAKPPPRGSKECPNNCNGVGVCDHDTGVRLLLPHQPLLQQALALMGS